MSSNVLAVAFAALWSSVNNLRLMADKGIVSPDEVDVSLALILEAVEFLGDAQLQKIVNDRLETMMAEIRASAARNAGQVN